MSKRYSLCIAVLILLGSLSPASISAEEKSDHDSKDKAAIRQAAKDYVAAVNRGDTEAIAAAWTAEGDLVDGTGQVSKGRDLARLAAVRRRGEEVEGRLAVTIDSLRFLSPETAIEDGFVESKLGDEGHLSFGRYTAIWVKRDGKWLLDGVREATIQRQTSHDHLRRLAWMIGAWQQDASEPVVTMKCQWSPDKNYLLREIKVASPEGAPMTISQRIGWDPSTQQFKGWTFDSDGSFSEANWSQEGERWNVSSKGVLKDGRTVLAKSVYAQVDDDTFTWESTMADEDGLPIPDRKLRLVRQPASK